MLDPVPVPYELSTDQVLALAGLLRSASDQCAAPGVTIDPGDVTEVPS